MRDDFKALAMVTLVICLACVFMGAMFLGLNNLNPKMAPVVVTLPSSDVHIVEIPTQYLICDVEQNLILTVTITDEIVSMDPPKEVKSC